MHLPEIKYSDNVTKDLQTTFRGLNHRRGAADGEIWDMQNMCSKDYPVLSVRPRRRLVWTCKKPNGLYSWDGLIWADGDGIYYKGDRICDCEDSRKTFAGIGNYVVILPDKMYFHTETLESGDIESAWDGSSLTFGNGKLYDEDADANMIQAEGEDWSKFFKEGDAVTISGCTIHPENNKTPIIRQIDGDKLYFYENVFVLDDSTTESGTDDAETEDSTEQEATVIVSSVPYTETGNLRIARTMPDMDYIWENENRLWGCKGNEIYASKLGDIFNWNVFDGLSTDSYATDVGSANKFSGGCSYASYPIFFKEDRIYKMYGNYPSNYQLMGSATLGMKDGCAGSLAIAGEKLIYLSRAGFTAYTGGVPNPIGDVFGDLRFFDAIAGSDGLKYYCAARLQDGSYRLLVFDTENNVWHIEDDIIPMGFTWYGANLYLMTYTGHIWIIGNPESADDYEAEENVEWFVEFADFTADDPNTKMMRKLQLRMDLDDDAEAQVWIQYDSSGNWEPVGSEISGADKHSVLLPVLPRRCDHYRIKITGTNGCRIYSLSRSFSKGTEYRGPKYR